VIINESGVDDLDILSNGDIIYSYATSRTIPERPDGSHDPEKASHIDIVSVTPSGKLKRFDPSTKKSKILIDNILFANGVVISPKEDFVLVASSGYYKIYRYWLKGEKEGTTDIFADNLPGFPDGMKRASDGGYWIPLFVQRNQLLDMLHPYPFLKKLMLQLPDFLIPLGKTIIIKLNEKGEITQYFHDLDREFGPITSVIEHEGKLYFGTLTRETISVFTLPK